MRDKKFRLFAIAVIAVVGFAIYDYKSTQKQEKQKQEQSFLLEQKPEQVEKIKIQSKTESIELERTKDGWQLVAPVKELADQKAAQDFLDGIAGEKSTEVAIEDQEINLSDFGLDSPLGTITLTSNSGESTAFTVGTRKNFEGDAFVRKNQESKIRVASSTWFPKFEKRAFDFRDKRLMKFPPAAIESVQIQRNGEKFQLVKKENDWIIQGKPDWKLDQNKVRELLTKLSQTEALEYIAEGDAKPAELQKWGLQSPRLKMTVQLKDQKTWQASFAAGSDKVHRAHTSVPNQVMKISPTDSDQFFSMTADSFRDRAEPFRFDKSRVKEIELHLSGNSRVLKAEEDKAQQILKALRDLKVTDFKEAPQGFWSHSIVLKGDGEDIFSLNWGRMQKGKVNGVSTNVFPAQTSAFAKTFLLSESEIASLKLDEGKAP